MSITAVERAKQEANAGVTSASRTWAMFGDLNSANIITQILLTAPTTWNGLFRDDASMKIAEIARMGSWECTVPYKQFDLSGVTTNPVVQDVRRHREDHADGRLDRHQIQRHRPHRR